MFLKRIGYRIRVGVLGAERCGSEELANPFDAAVLLSVISVEVASLVVDFKEHSVSGDATGFC